MRNLGLIRAVRDSIPPQERYWGLVAAIGGYGVLFGKLPGHVAVGLA